MENATLQGATYLRGNSVQSNGAGSRYMAVADVFYLPSYREGFRLMLIEAEAVGLLNVASKIYGTASFLLMCFNPRIVPVVLIRLAERCHRYGASPLVKRGGSL